MTSNAMDLLRKISIFFLFLFGTSTAVIEEDFFDGAVVPSEILILQGENVFLKIKNPVNGQTKCEYQKPGDKDRNTLDFAVTFSNEVCGIKISNVEKSHEGVWKLFSTFKNASDEISVRGVSVVKVQDPVPSIPSETRIYSPGENFAPDVDLNYCYVYKNLGSNTKISGLDASKCMIPEDVDEDFRNGELTVRLGVKGVPMEVSFTVNIESSGESITTTLTRGNSGNLQLSCNVQNMKNILKYCRFERVGDNFGLNLEEGTSSGNYRYFGSGFDKGHCGLEIIATNLLENTQWNCFLGLMDVEDASNSKVPDGDKRIYRFSSIIDASNDWDKLKILNEEKIIYQVDNESAIIQCNANNPFDRCWFQHPSKTIISVSDRNPVNDEDLTQYYGDGFNMGHCGLKIKQFLKNDEGEWKCGVAHTQLMKDAVKTFRVEGATSSLMPVKRKIDAYSRNVIMLECRVIPEGSLSSCQFITPGGQVFSIDERVTRNNAISGIYYFDPNKKLSDGYCSVVIASLSRVHAGRWTCSGRVFGQKDESFDSIDVTVDGQVVRRASFSWITLAIVLPLVAAIILTIVGTKMYRIYQRRQRMSRDSLGNISMTELRSNASSEGTSTSS